MASKEIKWSIRASREFRNTLSYFNKTNGSTAYSQTLIQKTKEVLNQLSTAEYLGRTTNKKNVRVLPLDVYLIFYEIQNGTIYILSFWDNRRNPKKRIST
jgi:plasmid stabilization system protein ParE